MFLRNVPEEWNNSYMVILFKGKGSALDRGNYRDLKLTDQVLKEVEKVNEKSVEKSVGDVLILIFV